MALIRCPECGRDISDKAPICPHCGITREDICIMLEEKLNYPGKNSSNNSDNVCNNNSEIKYYPTISLLNEKDKLTYGGGISEFRVNSIKKEINITKYHKAGDIVKFGRFDGESMEWIVLDSDNDSVLVISKEGLELRQYHEKVMTRSVTWEKSTIRKYLNFEFINNHFELTEQARIMEKDVLNEDNHKYGTRGGENTRDKIFLLSIDEARKLFANDESRNCRCSRYINSQYSDTLNLCDWWLRSPGDGKREVAYVNKEGYIEIFGCYAQCSVIAIRPALWLRID